MAKPRPAKLNRVIGKNIRKLRTDRNISIDELAQLLGVTQSFMGLVERGERGTQLFTLIKCCEIFSITMDDLIYDYNSKPCKKISGIELIRENIFSFVPSLNENNTKILMSIIRSMIEFQNK